MLWCCVRDFVSCLVSDMLLYIVLCKRPLHVVYLVTSTKYGLCTVYAKVNTIVYENYSNSNFLFKVYGI